MASKVDVDGQVPLLWGNAVPVTIVPAFVWPFCRHPKQAHANPLTTHHSHALLLTFTSHQHSLHLPLWLHFNHNVSCFV